MTTVAIDIQPQFRFTCMAVNANHFLHQPENMVKELNRQASIADKRILVENVNIDPESICAAVVKTQRNYICAGRWLFQPVCRRLPWCKICWMVCRHLLIITM